MASSKITAEVEVKDLTVEVTVKRPTGSARWRWFFAYHLIKLAGRVYPFHFQLYRTEELKDRVNLPPD